MSLESLQSTVQVRAKPTDIHGMGKVRWYDGGEDRSKKLYTPNKRQGVPRYLFNGQSRTGNVKLTGSSQTPDPYHWTEGGGEGGTRPMVPGVKFKRVRVEPSNYRNFRMFNIFVNFVIRIFLRLTPEVSLHLASVKHQCTSGIDRARLFCVSVGHLNNYGQTCLTNKSTKVPS